MSRKTGELKKGSRRRDCRVASEEWFHEERVRVKGDPLGMKDNASLRELYCCRAELPLAPRGLTGTAEWLSLYASKARMGKIVISTHL